MRIPRGWIVYEVSISDIDEIWKCLETSGQKGIQIIVFEEPIYLLGSLIRGGEKVFSRKYIVAGKNSVAVQENLCDEDHILIEMDAWGEARKFFLGID